MKHPWSITVSLILLFLAAQFIGLAIVHSYLLSAEGKWRNIPSVAGVSIERPDLTPTQAILYIVGAILIGSLLIFVIIHFRGMLFWKLWFACAIIMCLYIAFAAFVVPWGALALAMIIGLSKIFFPNKYLHNVSELFTYGGLAALFTPLLTVLAAFLLLLVLAVYDLYAVFKSKHMIKFAKFQTQSGVFAGLMLPYGKTILSSRKKAEKNKGNVAVLGGGDIGFPLFFAGAVLAASGVLAGAIVSVGAAAGLLVLLLIGQKGKFYPAIPFLTVGAAIGYLITLLM